MLHVLVIALVLPGWCACVYNLIEYRFFHGCELQRPPSDLHAIFHTTTFTLVLLRIYKCRSPQFSISRTVRSVFHISDKNCQDIKIFQNKHFILPCIRKTRFGLVLLKYILRGKSCLILKNFHQDTLNPTIVPFSTTFSGNQGDGKLTITEPITYTWNNVKLDLLIQNEI